MHNNLITTSIAASCQDRGRTPSGSSKSMMVNVFVLPKLCIALVVCDGVEEVVVAGIKAGMHHGTGDTKHSSASIL